MPTTTHMPRSRHRCGICAHLCPGERRMATLSPHPTASPASSCLGVRAALAAGVPCMNGQDGRCSCTSSSRTAVAVTNWAVPAVGRARIGPFFCLNAHDFSAGPWGQDPPPEGCGGTSAQAVPPLHGAYALILEPLVLQAHRKVLWDPPSPCLKTSPQQGPEASSDQSQRSKIHAQRTFRPQNSGQEHALMLNLPRGTKV